MSARLPCRYVSPYARLQPPITQTLQVSTEPPYTYTELPYTYTEPPYIYTEPSYTYTKLSYTYTELSYTHTEASYSRARRRAPPAHGVPPSAGVWSDCAEQGAGMILALEHSPAVRLT